MASMWSLIIGLLLLLLPLGPSSAIKFPLQGNVHPVGHFYVTLNIGVPPKPYFLDINTGSNLTWLDCQHPQYSCKGCNPNPVHPYYKPAAANLKVECHHPQCDAMRRDLPSIPPCPRKDRHPCHYVSQYVTGRSEGDLANDTISVGSEKKIIFFGCGYKQEDDPKDTTRVDGLLGLRKGEVGFVAQLKRHGMIKDNIIGHCLNSNNKGKSFLYARDVAQPSTVTWVPMGESQFYYSPGLATLFIDKQPIKGNPTFQAVFDSGTPYTYVPAQIYTDLVSRVRGTLSESSLEEVYHPKPLCWKGKRPFRSIDDVKNNFKPLSLKISHAQGTSYLDIPPQNYLIMMEGRTCLAILDGSSVPRLKKLNLILIGVVTMQDLLVIYDNDNKKLGWSHQQCERGA